MKRNRIRRIVISVLILGLFVPAGAEAAGRHLTGIRVEPGEDAVEIRLGIENNGSRRLGSVYYSGKRIRIQVDDTDIPDRKRLSVTPKDNLVGPVTAVRKSDGVQLSIQLKSRVHSMLEYIAFDPREDRTVITFRKPLALREAGGEAVQIGRIPGEDAMEEAAEIPEKAVAEVASPAVEPPAGEETPKPAENPKEKPEKTSLPLGEALIPLVTPKELQTSSSSGKPAKMGKNYEKKKKAMMAELFGTEEKAEKKQEPAAPAETPKAAEEKADFKIGEDVVDLTKLYIMAGAIVFLGGLWLLAGRGRKNRFARLAEEPFNVLKSKKIGKNRKIMVVEAEGRKLLLSDEGRGVKLVAELDGKGKPGKTEISDLGLSDDDSMDRSQVIPLPVRGPSVVGATPASKRPSFFGESSVGSDAFPPKAESEPSPDSDESLRKKLRALRQGR